MSAAPLPSAHAELARWMRVALIAGAAGVAVCVLGALVEPAHFFRSWLVAFCLVLGLALGSLVVIMLSYLVGGNWGFVTRRFLEASTRTLPLVTLLFLPLLLGLPYLYEWMKPGIGDPGSANYDPSIAKKLPYLNVEFFIIRAAIYFAIWNLLAFLLNAWSRRQDTARSPALNDRCAAPSAPGLILYVLTITFASIDWVMSLEPHWFSTIFMAVFGMGQVLAGFVFAIAMLLLVCLNEKPAAPTHTGGPPVTPPTPEGTQPAGSSADPAAHAPVSPPAAPSDVPTVPTQTLSDLGSLTLTFIMVWAYLALCQFLLIYSGNLPVEVKYYEKRGIGPGEGHTGRQAEPTDKPADEGRATDPHEARPWTPWTYVGLSLVVLHFFLPFLLLLNPSIKRNPRRVAAVALFLLFMRVVDLFWVIVPAFGGHGEAEQGFPILGALLYPAALVGVGGLWFAFYLWQVRRLPLTPQYNPAEVAVHGQAAH